MKKSLFHFALAISAFLLVVLTMAGCGKKVQSENPPSASIEDVRAADRAKRIEEFNSLTEEKILNSDFCTASANEDRLVNFLIRSQHALVDIRAAVGKEKVDNEYYRRHRAVARAAQLFIRHNPGVKLPDCRGIDPMYLIGDIWWSEVKLPDNQKTIYRRLLIKILQVEVADDLKDLRATSWAVQDHARFYFRTTCSRFDLTVQEMRQIGLKKQEINGITASVRD